VIFKIRGSIRLTIKRQRAAIQSFAMASHSQTAVVPRPSVGEEIANTVSLGVGLLAASGAGPLEGVTRFQLP
jgi:hypothetical protein